MSDTLVQIIFGWPAILISIALALIGLLKKRPWMLVLSGLVCIPFSWYLSRYQGLCTAALLLPAFQLGSVWAIRTGRMKLAWLLLLPVVLAAVGLAVVVLSQ